MDWLIIIALIALIALMQILHSRERKDLYNRIMARDYLEYSQDATQKKKPIRSFALGKTKNDQNQPDSR
jgi:hypothetical protein